MKTVTLTLEQYEALSRLARNGATPDRVREIDAFLVDVEKANGVSRSFLWVQWQEAGQALPPTAKFPEVWPPELRMNIERVDRAISRADIEKALSSRARRPVKVMVTVDPGAELGWTPIDDFFKGWAV